MTEEQEKYQAESEPISAEIIQLFDPPRRGSTPRASAAELAEYRRMWPLVMQMVREWQTIKGPGGCPIAGRLLGGD